MSEKSLSKNTRKNVILLHMHFIRLCTVRMNYKKFLRIVSGNI